MIINVLSQNILIVFSNAYTFEVVTSNKFLIKTGVTKELFRLRQERRERVLDNSFELSERSFKMNPTLEQRSRL